jgi:DNA recombination protein RmuC
MFSPMTQTAPDLWMILFLLAAACAGYLFWQGQRRRGGLSPADQHKLHGYEALAAERDGERARANDLAIKLAAETARAGEREQALIQASQTLEKTFESVAARALGQSQQSFLTLAKETFEKHEKAAAGGVKELVSPVQEQFTKLNDTITKMELARTSDKSALTEQMRQIGAAMSETQAVTGKLANALRAGPKTRGRWGEETLKNVLELSGLSSKIDFHAEHSANDGEGGKVRPDVIINLPGGRCIVVDSKVALSGYLDALDATDDAAREILLKKHAQELRNHMKLLSGKEYWRHLPATADFVIMFVPGDNFIAAAFEQDPTLYQDAFVSKIVIIGPSNLFALAKTIAYGWRQEETTKNAEEIAALGRELYTRLATLSDKIGGVGSSLDKSLKSYNELVATFDSRFVPQARKFKELGVAEGADPVEPKQIDSAPRLPAPQGELDFGGAARLKRSG